MLLRDSRLVGRAGLGLIVASLAATASVALADSGARPQISHLPSISRTTALLNGSGCACQSQIQALVGTGGKATKIWVEYGTSDSYGKVTRIQKVPANPNPSTQTVTISGLKAGVQYFYHFTVSTKTGHADGVGSFVQPGKPVPAFVAPTDFKYSLGSLAGGGLDSLAADDGDDLSMMQLTSAGTDFYAEFSDVPASPSQLLVTAKSSSDFACQQSLSIYDFKHSLWQPLDSRAVDVPQEIAGLTPTGTLSNYVSNTGLVRVDVACNAAHAESFTNSTGRLNIAWAP